MEKFDRELDALDHQIAFFTTFGLNGSEIAKQLGRNKSNISKFCWVIRTQPISVLNYFYFTKKVACGEKQKQIVLHI